MANNTNRYRDKKAAQRIKITGGPGKGTFLISENRYSPTLGTAVAPIESVRTIQELEQERDGYLELAEDLDEQIADMELLDE